jgi:glycerophosphoryl diester phosphodiesterase
MRFSLSALLDNRQSPAPDLARVAFLARQPYAHRGLHGSAIIENSRAAFRAAIREGYGIELDVQAALGGEPFVFHDATLERLTREEGRVIDHQPHELDRITLRGTAETIPRLTEILELIGGKVPLLIEVKAKGPLVGGFCLSIRRTLEGYRGPVAVMSFNPEIGHWFAHHAPRIVRGLVVTEENDGETRLGRSKGEWQRHASLWRAQPDFLAYDVRDLPSRFAGAQRERGLPVLVWTVRNAAQERTALTYADEAIFEKPRA